MTWVSASATATGARHRVLGLLSEDSHRSGMAEGRAVVVVADGHGSDRCTRAREGARFGVDVVYSILNRCPPVETTLLARATVEEWRAAVDGDLELRPIPDLVSTDEGRSHYGTTVIGVCADDRLLRMIQIGDGDVVLAGRGTRRARRPHPATTSGPATDSLCHGDAVQRARVSEYALEGDLIDLVLVATDGFDTAFEHADWHDQVMRDLRARLADLDSDELADVVSQWCRLPAHVGGDDTTLALLVRTSVLCATGPGDDGRNDDQEVST